MARSPYASVFERLVANTEEPATDTSCWVWAARTDRWAYGQINLYVPGLAKVVTLKAHIVMWLRMELGPVSIDDLYLAYLEHSASGMELDHLCSIPCCINPDHLELVTGSENCQRRNTRRK